MSDTTDTLTPEEQDAHVAATEGRLREAGVPTHENVQQDYFGFEDTQRVPLPDGVSWVEIRVFNEGQRRAYLNKVNRDLRVQKTTGDTLFRMAPGEERRVLLDHAIVDWNLHRSGSPVPFNKSGLNEFLDTANPRIVDIIEKEVRKQNPWLLSEMSVEDIDKEISNLQEMRETKVREEEGKETSGS